VSAIWTSFFLELGEAPTIRPSVSLEPGKCESAVASALTRKSTRR
jgi:hypothetical protein